MNAEYFRISCAQARVCAWSYLVGSWICEGMSDSSYMGRFHSARSMVDKMVLFIRSPERGMLLMVSITNCEIWGQARGFRDEQTMTPILVAVCGIFCVLVM